MTKNWPTIKTGQFFFEILNKQEKQGVLIRKKRKQPDVIMIVVFYN